MLWRGGVNDRIRPGSTSRRPLIDLYYVEGLAEGVRPELALAQAALETGDFMSTDTTIHNYAGIGHPDGAGSGFPVPVARGRRPGPRAAAARLRRGQRRRLRLRTGRPGPERARPRWSSWPAPGPSTPRYAEKVVTVLTAITGAPVPGPAPMSSAANVSCAGLTGAPVSVDGYSLPVDRVWYDQQPNWFAKPHHDYPAADVPVPEGTAIYAMVSGTVTAAPVGGRCGLGVSYRGDDGLAYIACHGFDGGLVVRPGDRVSAGQVIMHAGWTGNVIPPGPGGTHLHQGVRRNGDAVCPQPLFAAIYERRPVDLAALPTTGCSY